MIAFFEALPYSVAPMNVDLEKTFRFEAAHHLPNVSVDHPCRRPHGHSYRITVRVSGPVDPHVGWFIDFAEISAVVAPLIAQLDHRDLNTIAGLENPTAEHLCGWIWERIHGNLPGLVAVEVAETETARCIYTGPTKGNTHGEKQ